MIQGRPCPAPLAPLPTTSKLRYRDAKCIAPKKKTHFSHKHIITSQTSRLHPVEESPILHTNPQIPPFLNLPSRKNPDPKVYEFVPKSFIFPPEIRNFNSIDSPMVDHGFARCMDLIDFELPRVTSPFINNAVV